MLVVIRRARVGAATSTYLTRKIVQA